MAKFKMFLMSALDLAGLKHIYASHDVYPGIRKKSADASDIHRARAIAAANKLREQRSQRMKECA